MGCGSIPETGPRRAELVVGKNRNEVEIRSEGPGATKSQSGWSSDSCGRCLGYAERTK